MPKSHTKTTGKDSNVAFFLCIGCIIGWGAFVLPGDLFLSKIGLFNAIIGLGFGALLMALIARDYIFLLANFPQVGGEFIFTLRIFGKKHAFICGWFLTLAYLCIIPLNATNMTLLTHAFGFTPQIALYTIDSAIIYGEDIAICLGAVIIACIINLCGIHYSLALQKVFVVILVGSVCIFFFLMSFNNTSWQNLFSYIDSQNISISGILVVLFLTPWLYIGFNCGVQIIQDVEDNTKKVSIFTICAILAGFILYTLVLIITGFSIPLWSLEASDMSFLATINGIRGFFGLFGSVILALGVFGAIVSGINGFFVVTTKVLQAMSLYRIFPIEFAAQNRFGAPYKIICFIASISSILPFFGRQGLSYIADIASVGIVVVFIYVSVMAFVLKRKKHSNHTGFYLISNPKPLKNSNYLSTLSLLNICISGLFLLLFFLPFSPVTLKNPSLLVLVVWFGCGILMYYFSNNKTLDL